MNTNKNKNAFFYIILTSHNKTLGYGRTGDPKSRLQDYVGMSAAEQEFSLLYYGPKSDIFALEEIVKQRCASYSLIYNSWTLEWINPKYNKTVDDLVELVEQIILANNLNIKKIKDNFLPFYEYWGKPPINRKTIDANPDHYLEQI